MPNAYTNDTFSTIYKDDYRDSDHYHRILFNSGRALQARELTQLQTIIQNEVARIGRNLYRDGSAVNPGGITVNNKYYYIKIDPTFNVLPDDPQVLIGNTFITTTVSPGIKFRIIDAYAGTETDPPTLYVSYLDTLSGTDSASSVVLDPVFVPNGAEFEVAGVYQFKAAAVGAAGTGTIAHVQQGDFFTKDHFVFTESQSLVLSKYSSFPDVDLGFKIIEDIVTAIDNPALYDNQGATPNLTSPGADRYRIRLELTTRDQIQNEDNFVFIARIERGLLVEEQSVDIYNDIYDKIAERTAEADGDFISQPFVISLDELNDSNLVANVSPGTAYVQGYRIDLPATKVPVKKSITTETINNQAIYPSYGNYVIGNPSNNTGLFNINTLQQVQLRSSINFGGTTLGTARVRGIEASGAAHKYYLFQVRMNPGENFREVRSFGTAASNYVNVVLDDVNASIYESTKNYMFFPLPRSRPSFTGLSDVVLTVQRYFEFSATGTTATVTAGGGDVFTDTNNWVLCKAGSAITTNATYSFGGSPQGSQVTIGNISAGNWQLVAFVQKADPVTSRTKGLEEDATETLSWAGRDIDPVSGVQSLELAVPDVIRVKEIRATDANGNDLSANFVFDNGQRDNFYDKARLILKSGTTISAANIFVKYDYFTHSASGNYFDVTSYDGAVLYKDIPDYTTATGVTFNLRDVIDFRPTVNTLGNFSGGTARVNPIPQNNSTITADVNYFQGRKDKFVVSPLKLERNLNRGQLKLIQGTPSLSPNPPDRPAGTLDIYNMELYPGTLNDSDLTLNLVNNKRYTMKDIGRLEDKINRVAEVASLGLLELNTSILTTLDSQGNDRTKSGFFADNFKDFSFTDLFAEDYRASLDKENDCILPRYYPNDTRLLFDSNDANNGFVVLKGDNLYIPYNTELLTSQDIASTFTNVNPFEVILNIGHMDLSPASDAWIETDWAPDAIIDKGTRVNNVGTKVIETRDWGGLVGSIVGGLIGTAIIGLTGGLGAGVVGSALAGLGSAGALTAAAIYSVPIVGSSILSQQLGSAIGSAIGGQVFKSSGVSNSDVITGDRVDFKYVGDKLLSSVSIPYMRSIKVSFRAQSLRPNSRHFAFFDGVPVSNWCRRENKFQRYSGTEQRYGNVYRNATEHPDGSTNLYTDSAGTLIGSFFIPSTSDLKFRTGTKMFKLLDISADSDNGALSSAAAQFTSAGQLETWQRQIESTRIVEVMTVIEKKKAWYCFWDPIAQSFFVNQRTYPNGIFLTDVDLYFQSKDVSVPVQVQIREVENGTPVEYPLPGAVKFVNSADVRIPGDTNNLNSIRANPTKFEFEEPIYLSPNREYAIVVLAESTEYNVYVADIYDFIIGTTEARVAKQPALGVFFESQNGTTWSPVQTRDLMFKINKAVFDPTGYVYLKNGQPPDKRLVGNPIETTSGSNVVKINHLGHGFIKNDFVTLSGLDESTLYGGVSGSIINGTHQIVALDWSGYKIELPEVALATETIRSGGNDLVATQNAMINEMIPLITNLQPEATSLSAQAKFTTGDAWGLGRGTDLNDAYDEFDYVPVELNNLNLIGTPMMVASRDNELEYLSGNASTTFLINMETTDRNVSPILDLQRSTLLTVENSIDWQLDYNTPMDYVPETEPSGGSSASKHITKITNLISSAVGLHVLFSAAIPNEARIDVYYRTAVEGENIRDKNWEFFEPSGSGAQGTGSMFLYREYQYLIGGQAGNMSPFTQFQLKFVMKSYNSSLIPRIADARVIALAV